jgi:hypothetical protein
MERDVVNCAFYYSITGKESYLCKRPWRAIGL